MAIYNLVNYSVRCMGSVCEEGGRGGERKEGEIGRDREMGREKEGGRDRERNEGREGDREGERES